MLFELQMGLFIGKNKKIRSNNKRKRIKKRNKDNLLSKKVKAKNNYKNLY